MSDTSIPNQPAPVLTVYRGRPRRPEAILKSLRSSVYHPLAEDLVRLRGITGLTQRMAYQTIFPGEAKGHGRWALWELKSRQYRPGRAASRRIMEWASGYNKLTQEWVESLKAKAWRQKLDLLKKLSIEVAEGIANE